MHDAYANSRHSLQQRKIYSVCILCLLHFAEHFGCNKPPQHSVFKISLNKKVLMCNKISTNIIIIIYTSGFSYVFMHYVLCIIMFYPDLKRSIATCPR